MNNTIKAIIELILIVLGALGISLIVNAAIQHYQFESFVKECNQDFGIGNWTFTETSGAWQCQMQESNRFSITSVTSTYSQECYINHELVNCSEMEER